MKYAIEIERQNATIEIRTTPAKLKIQGKRPSFKVMRTPVEPEAVGVDAPEKATAKAQPTPARSLYEAPKDIVQLSKRFEGYNNGAEAVGRMAGNAEETKGNEAKGNALSTAMMQRREAAEQAEAKREAAKENQEWDPGYVKMSWDAQAMEIQWDIHPLEVEYEPYSVEITMKDYPSVKIRAYAVGHRVDRRI